MPRISRSGALRPLRPRLAVAIGVVVGVLAAFSTIYSIGLFPPKVESRHVTVAAAAVHAVLDPPESLIGATRKTGYDEPGQAKRAALFANLIASRPVRDDIARRVGISPDQLATRARLTLAVQWAMRDPDAEQRANQLLLARRPYKIELQADPRRPVLHIYSQAPSVREAEELADAALAGLRAYLQDRGLPDGAEDASSSAVIHQLGQARGAVVNAAITPQMVIVAFLVGFGVTLALLLGFRAVAAGWAATAAGRPPVSATPPRSDPRFPEPPVPGGAWPHTTRVLPWMIAGLTVVFWLVPFNAIQLSVSLPFDAKLDRLILPVLFGVWLLTLAAGGPASPRLRMTLIHIGILGFLAAASLSIAVNAQELNRNMEFDLSFKKLTLLCSYVLIFTIVASSIRRVEVRAFLKLNLVLGVICAAGVIWEYRFKYNPFYDVSGMLLPGVFSVGAAAVDARDSIGRVMTFGPTDHPLEVAALLTMALPIALVGILQSTDRRSRILYGLAACFLLAGAISTYRKTALLGPVFIVLTIAYFRRRELMKLAPLGFVALAAIHVLSPGAFGSIVFQLQPSRLGVATVSDRASDYDAVRPDVWSHLVFGRGYGSYDHVSYRILDSEMLSRLVDVGIVGTVATILMLLLIVVAARRTINARDPERSPAALAVASSAVAFFVFTFLFDVTSFPHVPYVLLTLAALLCVVLTDGAARAPSPPTVARGHGRTHGRPLGGPAVRRAREPVAS